MSDKIVSKFTILIYVMLERISIACMRKARRTMVENVRWLGADGSIAVTDSISACPPNSIRYKRLIH